VTETALRPGGLPHLLLRQACALGLTGVQLLERAVQRHGVTTRTRTTHTKALSRLVWQGLLHVVGHLGKRRLYALTPAGEARLEELEDEWVSLSAPPLDAATPTAGAGRDTRPVARAELTGHLKDACPVRLPALSGLVRSHPKCTRSGRVKHHARALNPSADAGAAALSTTSRLGVTPFLSSVTPMTRKGQEQCASLRLLLTGHPKYIGAQHVPTRTDVAGSHPRDTSESRVKPLGLTHTGTGVSPLRLPELKIWPDFLGDLTSGGIAYSSSSQTRTPPFTGLQSSCNTSPNRGYRRRIPAATPRTTCGKTPVKHGPKRRVIPSHTVPLPPRAWAVLPRVTPSTRKVR
jgi:hypothetical protein